MDFEEWIKAGRKGRLQLNRIPGYEDIANGFYLLDGKLYGKKDKAIKGSWTRDRRYPYSGVTLKTADGRKTHRRKDRIIALAFVDGRTDQRDEVDHMNGKHNDDRPENLRWVTRQENIDFKVLRQRKKPKPVKILPGQIEFEWRTI